MPSFIQSFRQALLVSTALLLAVKPAAAIVYNDALAEANGGAGNYYDSGSLYTNVVALGFAGCTGTLINARTVLTAAHCVVKNGTINATATGTVFFGNQLSPASPTVAATALIPYSNYSFPAGDIALVSLATPVTNLKPVTLAPAGYTIPVGATVTMVGYGAYGTGSEPPTALPNDGKRRVATTALGGYVALQNLPLTTAGGPLFNTSNNQGQPVWAAQFRYPVDPTQTDAFGLVARGIPVLPTEGAVAPGDSGGPLFYNDPVLGLIELGDVIGGSQQISGAASNGYGEVNIWTPTGVFADWLAANNPLQQVSSKAGTFNWSNAAAWSGNVVPNDFAGTVDYGGQALQQVTVPRYYNVTLQNPGTITVDINPTIDSLTISGASAALVVPQANTLTTLVGSTITAGTLQLDGVHVTPQVTLNGLSALLAGHGTVQGNVVNTMGVVAPGGNGAIGQLGISGNYTQGMAGMLSIRLAGAASDRLVVGGTATLAGGTLALSQAAGLAPVAGGNYAVLSAAQVSGNFAAVASSLGAALSPSVTTTATGVSVTINQLPFARFAADANSAGLATALTTVEARVPTAMLAAASTSAPLGQLAVPTANTQVAAEAQDVEELDTLTAAQLTAALDSIVPQGVHVQSDAAREASIVASDAVSTRLGNLRAGIGGSDYSGFAMQSQPVRLVDARDNRTALPVGSQTQVRLLPEGVGSFLTGTVIFGSGGPGGTEDFTTAGVTAGFDAKIGTAGRVGIALTYANEGRAGTGGTKANIQSVLPTLYASWSPGAFYVDGYAGGGWNTATMHRPVNVGFDSYTARSSASGTQILAGVTAGLRFSAGAISYGPLAAFDFSHARFAAINEVGAGAFATSIDPRSSDSARGTIGARAEYRWQTAWGVLVPSVKAAFTHDFGDRRDKATARLQAAPDLPFGVTGPAWTNNYATIGVGLGTQLTRNIAASTAVQTYLGHGVATQLSAQAVLTF